MSFQSILVPIDFDDATSEEALDHALALAGKLGAKVTVVHVYSLPIYNLPDGSYLPSAEVTAGVEAAARGQLGAFLARRRAAGATLEGVLREGRAADAICDVAKEIGADLIVMGTHGRGLVGRALLGSVAQRVLRDSPVPVMTMHVGER